MRFGEHVSEHRPNLKRVATILDQTAVISDDFKAEIWGWVTAAVREGYEDGVRAGREAAENRAMEQKQIGMYGGGDK